MKLLGEINLPVIRIRMRHGSKVILYKAKKLTFDSNWRRFAVQLRNCNFECFDFGKQLILYTHFFISNCSISKSVLDLTKLKQFQYWIEECFKAIAFKKNNQLCYEEGLLYQDKTVFWRPVGSRQQEKYFKWLGHSILCVVDTAWIHSLLL